MATNQILKSQAIPLIAQGLSHREIAKMVGVAQGTVSRWAADPAMKAYIAQLNQSSVDLAREHLERTALNVAKALTNKATFDDAPGSVTAMVAALSVVGLSSSTKMTIENNITVTDPNLPHELAKALKAEFLAADPETRAALLAELLPVLTLNADPGTQEPV